MPAPPASCRRVRGAHRVVLRSRMLCGLLRPSSELASHRGGFAPARRRHEAGETPNLPVMSPPLANTWVHARGRLASTGRSDRIPLPKPLQRLGQDLRPRVADTVALVQAIDVLIVI